MHADEEKFSPPALLRDRLTDTRLQRRICLVSCLFFDPSVLDFAVQIASEACGLYAGRLIGRWGGRNISHLSCLRDKAVCQSSHINNVTGRNVPGLWRSHGSLLIPFDWGNDLHCWTQRDDISLAAFRQSKEIRQPLTPTPLQLHLSSDHPPHLPLHILVLFVLFARHLSRKKECGCFK